MWKTAMFPRCCWNGLTWFEIPLTPFERDLSLTSESSDIILARISTGIQSTSDKDPRSDGRSPRYLELVRSYMNVSVSVFLVSFEPNCTVGSHSCFGHWPFFPRKTGPAIFPTRQMVASMPVLVTASWSNSSQTSLDEA